jgi:hypothetical protein
MPRPSAKAATSGRVAPQFRDGAPFSSLHCGTSLLTQSRKETQRPQRERQLEQSFAAFPLFALQTIRILVFQVDFNFV